MRIHLDSGEITATLVAMATATTCAVATAGAVAAHATGLQGVQAPAAAPKDGLKPATPLPVPQPPALFPNSRQPQGQSLGPAWAWPQLNSPTGLLEINKGAQALTATPTDGSMRSASLLSPSSFSHQLQPVSPAQLAQGPTSPNSPREAAKGGWYTEGQHSLNTMTPQQPAGPAGGLPTTGSGLLSAFAHVAASPQALAGFRGAPIMRSERTY